MVSLQHLPNELLDQILAQVSQHDKLNTILSCRAFHRAIIPSLYTSISLEWLLENRQCNLYDEGEEEQEKDRVDVKTPRIHVLLRTLIEKPRYVKMVKQLEFYAPNFWAITNDSDEDDVFRMPESRFDLRYGEKTLFKKVIDDLNVPNRELWKRVVDRQDDYAVYQMLIVVICANLQFLSVSIEFLIERDWLSPLVRFEHPVATLAAKTPKFDKLQCVGITSEAYAFLPPMHYYDLMPGLLRLFYLPKLKTLELAGFFDKHDTASPSWWPWQEGPQADRLTALRINGRVLNMDTLRLVLKQTPRLKVFHYSCVTGAMDGKNA